METTKLLYAIPASIGRLHGMTSTLAVKNLAEAVRDFLECWDEPDSPEAVAAAVDKIREAVESFL